MAGTDLDRRIAAWSGMRDRYSSEVLSKAERILEQGAVQRDDETDNVWWVQGNSKRPYRVSFIGEMDEGWLTCTCTNGRSRGGQPNCYHTASVVLLEYQDNWEKARRSGYVQEG